MQESTLRKPFLPYPAWLYIAVWVACLWLFIDILSFHAEAATNVVLSGLYFIEFRVHEASHLVFGFLPSIGVAAMGSVGEITFTLLLLFTCFYKKAYFAAVFAGIWVMLAFNSVGRYIADARAQQLPLIGPGETVQHDWHYVLSQLNLLNNDLIIGGAVRTVGDIIGALALAFGIYLIVQKIRSKKHRQA